MAEYVIRIRGKTAAAEGDPLIVCGNSVDTVRFCFDTEWEGSGRQAHFSYRQDGVLRRITVPFTGDTCPLPVLRGVCEIEAGLSAGSLCTAVPAVIPCVPCITDLSAADRPPEYDLFAEMLAAYSEKQVFSRQYALLDADGCAVRDRDGFAVTVKG